jgi:hypothetical protein
VGAGDCRRNGRFVRDVHPLEAGGAAELGNRGGPLGFIEVEQRKACALCREVPGHAQAKPGDAAGDDGPDVADLHAGVLALGRRAL